jgi:hypothetical protein
MAKLSVGDEVDVVIDGIGIRRGTVHELPNKTIVVVKTGCTGADTCDLGYPHVPGQEKSHLSRVKVGKVNRVRLPKPLLRYEDINWGPD